MADVSESQYAGYYVQPLEQKKALAILEYDIAIGRDPKIITGISDDYYIDKVISGLCPMSAIVYYRVCLEKPLPKKEEKIHCLRCGKEIGEYTIYCSNCKHEIRQDRSAKSIGFGRFHFGKKTKKFVYEH